MIKQHLKDLYRPIGKESFYVVCNKNVTVEDKIDVFPDVKSFYYTL
jgi:hypothetical protein